MPTPLRHIALGQVPAVPPPPTEIGSGPGGLIPTVIGIGIAVLVLAVALLLLRRVWRRGQRKAAPPPPVEALPQPRPVERVELPPSDREVALRGEAATAADAARALREQRDALADSAKREADRERREALIAQERALREQEEAHKRAEYQAKKAVEAEERERKRREREEQARLDEERLKEEARQREEDRRHREEEERLRLQREAGRTLASGLAKTRSQGFMARLNALVAGGPKEVDEATLGQLEELLFTADIGVKTAAHLVDVARARARANELKSPERLKAMIRAEIERMVSLPSATARLSGGGPPHVLMVVGVNGSGKTTTIGKLAARAGRDGRKVLLAAGDTFRAAAAEQLDVWAERAGAALVKGKDEADPASVVFEAIKTGVSQGVDLIIADTAGRLHTKAPLMDELKKVKRVIDKALPGAPHEVLLVVDATNGQNAIAQAKQFQEAVGVTAIALTKLDGTAKGGVIIGIADELKLPVAWVGVGEAVEDLRPFEPKEFVAALFDDAG